MLLYYLMQSTQNTDVSEATLDNHWFDVLSQWTWRQVWSGRGIGCEAAQAL